MGSAGLNAAITPSLEPIVFYDYTLEGMRRLIAALTSPRFRASEELIRARHARSIDPDTRRAYTATMEWIRRQGGLFYAEDEIRRVKTPVLVVNGKDDQVVPLANAYRFLELLENSWGHLIPHCGHWAMLEASQEFAAVTRHFLEARWPA
jgi:2-hydroxy-6-oxo-6-(2'-aminophenyl)hexa-2,4-dienoate hydrolase